MSDNIHNAAEGTQPAAAGAAVRARRRLSLGWAIVILFIVTFAIGAANLVYTSTQVDAQRSHVDAACAFYADLAGLPVTSATGAKPSELGVAIVAHSRGAARGLGCPHIPPPSPSFVTWAKVYGLPSS